MADINQSLVDNLAPINDFTVYANTDLGTSASKIVAGKAGDAAKYGTRLIKILNGSTTARLAWKLVNKDAAAPTVSADFDANAGDILLPEQSTEWLPVPANKDIYLVASAASTSYCVTVIDRS